MHVLFTDIVMKMYNQLRTSFAVMLTISKINKTWILGSETNSYKDYYNKCANLYKSGHCLEDKLLW
jgi:hypothetical protein